MLLKRTLASTKRQWFLEQSYSITTTSIRTWLIIIKPHRHLTPLIVTYTYGELILQGTSNLYLPKISI